VKQNGEDTEAQETLYYKKAKPEASILLKYNAESWVIRSCCSFKNWDVINP
jgi:hypothetical protein